MVWALRWDVLGSFNSKSMLLIVFGMSAFLSVE